MAPAQGSIATASSGPTANIASPNELVFVAFGFPSQLRGAAIAGRGYTTDWSTCYDAVYTISALKSLILNNLAT
jgi:hypothetical protein